MVVEGLLISGAVLTVAYVGWQSAPHLPPSPTTSTRAGSMGRAQAADVAPVGSSVTAAHLQAGMVVDYHGRHWTVVRVHPVRSHPGMLLELQESGIPGFHVVYVDPTSTLTVVRKA